MTPAPPCGLARITSAKADPIPAQARLTPGNPGRQAAKRPAKPSDASERPASAGDWLLVELLDDVLLDLGFFFLNSFQLGRRRRAELPYQVQVPLDEAGHGRDDLEQVLDDGVLGAGPEADLAAASRRGQL